MKNYVVWTNCTIRESRQQFAGIEAAGNREIRAAYENMFRISQASARKFLQGEWESIVIADEVETRVDMFKQNWQKIWDIWHGEPCNILYLDSDTMFIQTCAMFGVFKEFRLFNWTDPKSNGEFLNYYNAGVRYYSSEMRPETWMVGEAEAEKWNLRIWDQEQVIFNRMFWSQALNSYDRHVPEYNWQALPNLPGPNLLRSQELWNCTPLQRVRVVHYSGSRDARHTARFMDAVAKDIGVEYVKAEPEEFEF